MFRRLLRHLVRHPLERMGYVLWKREFLVYGVSPYLDITRLDRFSNSSVRIFFDVGANVGQTSEVALRTFPEARVFAFEPHPDVFRQLEGSLAGPRTSLHQVALGEHHGPAVLFEYGASGAGSLINSLVPNALFPTQFGHAGKERAVDCTTIDRFCESHSIDSIDVLKIDTEGHDLCVLKGASHMLRERRIRFIYTEFNDLHPRAGAPGGALLPTAEFLAPFGFRFIATYTDFVLPGEDLFVCANALFNQAGTIHTA